jgi:MFS family permease
MQGLARLLPYALAFTSSLCIMILELVSSRLVAPHVGSSLTVWTSVIGIILGGICLGNVLGGRLADRVQPRRAIGPLFTLGAFLTLGTLWMNGAVGSILPHPDQMNWELRTVLVVMLDFLIPATILGMVGPVVAKMAVEQAAKAGSAIGDVYFWGAIGSIAGTFLCGFALMALAATSTIVILVAAALALLGAVLIGTPGGWIAGSLTSLLLVLGSIPALVSGLGLGGVDLGAYTLNYIVVAGNVLACVLAIIGLTGLLGARQPDEDVSRKPVPDALLKGQDEDQPRPGLWDLAALAFVASMVFMALEMVAGRLVTRHLGSSIYGWTSVIAVLLAGLSFGNFLGGKIADFIKNEKHASWLFLVASVLTLVILVLESPPKSKWVRDWFMGEMTENRSVLSSAITLTELPLPGGNSLNLSWPYRILLVVTIVFFLPALSMGTVSPVVAKLAVDRLKRYHRTGTAIGEVYAWGMVGSILGTFLTGFFLIDTLGSKGVILLLGTILAFGATMLGSLGHAVWAGIPLGLCVLAFTPLGWVDAVNKRMSWFPSAVSFEKIGLDWGIREKQGNPDDNKGELAWIDESKYYYIKIENELLDDGDTQRRTLVLDNLIHGYFVVGHPERLDYDYEHIYALVAYRAAKAGGKVKFKPMADAKEEDSTPSPDAKPGTDRPSTPAEPSKDRGVETPKPADTKDAGTPPPKAETGLRSIPALNQDDKGSSGQAKTDPAGQPESKAPAGPPKTEAPPQNKTGAGPAEPPKQDVPQAEKTKTDSAAPEKTGTAEGEKKGASDEPVKKVLTDDLSKLKGMVFDDERSEPYIPRGESTMKTLFLGGGAYCFQRHMQYVYEGTGVDVAEIDPAVTNANYMATGLPRDTTIQTYWGDARQFVELHQDANKYDLVFGDAFNDFSVPWHLTTREFNEKIKKMLTPNGVYMINIIDVYQSDKEAEKKALNEIEKDGVTDESKKARIRKKHLDAARRYGGFLGAWTKTAKETFDHVYIFGTDEPGGGRRETFVVVASMQDLDLKDLGLRKDDPRYFTPSGKQTKAEVYGPEDEKVVVENRSRNIILTDDYAPVENLLAPVAETRGDDD